MGDPCGFNEYYVFTTGNAIRTKGRRIESSSRIGTKRKRTCNEIEVSARNNESVQESNIKSPMLKMQLTKCIVELDGKLEEKKLEIVKEKLKFRKLKIKLYSYVVVELDPLLLKIKLEEDEEGKRSRALKMKLNEDITKLELLQEETELEERHVAEIKGFIVKAKKINLAQEKRTMESLMLQLVERKVEFKSLLEEMKAMRA